MDFVPWWKGHEIRNEVKQLDTPELNRATGGWSLMVFLFEYSVDISHWENRILVNT